MGVPVLANGHVRVSVLTAKPSNIGAPTTTELNAGFYASPYIPESLWNWSAGDPNTTDDTSLEATFSTQVPTSSTYDLSFGLYRRYLTGGGIDTTDDALFAASKTPGTVLYVYARQTDKLSTVAWASTDEIFLGGQVMTYDPQNQSGDGYIKYKIPLFPQDMRKFIAVA